MIAVSLRTKIDGMETLLLKDPEAYPSDARLDTVLQGSFMAFRMLRRKLESAGCVLEWRYYNDGKAWLCKLLCGRRNMGWLHVYDGFFRVTFYFTEKHRAAVVAAEIPAAFKETFARTPVVGRLIPLSVRIGDESGVDAAMAVFRLKRSVK